MYTTPGFLNLSRAIFWQEEAVQEFLRFIGSPATLKSIAELGCGAGFMTRRLALAFPNTLIVGIDLNQQALQAANTAIAALPDAESVLLTAADARLLPLCSNTLDCIVSHFFLTDAANPEMVLAEVWRTLRPGGWFCAMEPVFQTDFANSYYPGVTAEELEALSVIFQVLLRGDVEGATGDRLMTPRLPSLLRQTGFTEIKLQPTSYYFDSTELSDEQLAQYQHLARLGLQQQITIEAAQRAAPVLRRLTAEQLTLLIGVQRRLLQLIANDPTDYRRAGFFTTMSCLLARGCKA